MTSASRKLLIVEDEKLMQGMLQVELSKFGFDIVTVDSAVTAKAEVNRFDPDIALIDIGLKGSLSGIHLGHFLHVQHPDIAQVYLTKFEDASAAATDGMGLPPGAGFVSKHYVGGTDALIDEIDRVVRGKQSNLPGEEIQDDLFLSLSPKAKRVLELLANGYSNQHIARDLDVSQKTVEYYVDSVYKSLEISKTIERNSRVEAALRYQRMKFTREVD